MVSNAISLPGLGNTTQQAAISLCVVPISCATVVSVNAEIPHREHPPLASV